ncbi:helix-turn-helix domain-containing protein [Staphylococcus caeli]|uniref:Helix-turn-helix DNA binding protein n=1 Tax=Staphylococcus caeli TaxID=2201815 RepID=A0A1D4QH34_9STAP|nr:helix-turn-helix transcriptional regulator [Staphylococcus caeli]SCT27412.1 helix-turn-helix DNA binding protein [Staphylococcus caeli]SCT34538.1 helix-turn-helix DNA binding protein [Staphylococcus caeli]
MINFNLKEILDDKDMTISKLNELTGISRNSLSLLLNGKSRGIQFDTLEKIVNALNVNIEDLFSQSFNTLKFKVENKKYFFQDKEIEAFLDFKTSKELTNINNTTSYSLKCDFELDNIKYQKIIPYVFSIEFSNENSIYIYIDLYYDNFSDVLKILYSTFGNLKAQHLLVNYITDNILNLEKDKTNIIDINNVNVYTRQYEPRINSVKSLALNNNNLLKESEFNRYINSIENLYGYNVQLDNEIIISKRQH